MATVVLTIEDNGEGVKIDGDFTPAITGELTFAQEVAIFAIDVIRKALDAEVTIND